MASELNIARKIRQIRLQSKLTLERVAEVTGFTKSYLSMVESGKKLPPIPSLSKIAKALDVGIVAFFDQRRPEDRITWVRKAEGKVVVRDGTAFGHRYESVAPTKRQKKMDPFIVTDLPKSNERGFKEIYRASQAMN
jgi:transcriptional regulator with XRE-family HTH domain